MIKILIKIAILSIITFTTANSKSDMKNDIEIKNAYVRMMPPTARMSASFMDIKNNFKKDIFLIKVKSDISEFTEMHLSNRDRKTDMMNMRKVEKIKIPSNSSKSLKKGSYHIMFINLKKPLIKNKNVDIELKFSNGYMKHIKIPVK